MTVQPCLFASATYKHARCTRLHTGTAQDQGHGPCGAAHAGHTQRCGLESASPGPNAARHGVPAPARRRPADAGAGQAQVQDGFPTDRVLTKRGNLVILYDAATRMLKQNTTDVYPVVLGNGDNKTYTFYFPHPLPNAAVGDAVAVRCLGAVLPAASPQGPEQLGIMTCAPEQRCMPGLYGLISLSTLTVDVWSVQGLLLLIRCLR